MANEKKVFLCMEDFERLGLFELLSSVPCRAISFDTIEESLCANKLQLRSDAVYSAFESYIEAVNMLSKSLEFREVFQADVICKGERLPWFKVCRCFDITAWGEVEVDMAVFADNISRFEPREVVYLLSSGVIKLTASDDHRPGYYNKSKEILEIIFRKAYRQIVRR